MDSDESDFEIIIESDSDDSDFEIILESDSDESDSEYNGSEKKNNDKYIKVLSIDVGIINLGLSVSIINKDYTLKEIVYIDLLDITKFLHKDDPKKCKLYHNKTISDWMEHLFIYHQMFFEQCDVILVENQPITGIKSVEQLIYNRYRDKIVLISPNKMHKYFKINHLDYESRKIETEKITKKYLNKYLLNELNNYTRKHDISDSVCIMLFWLNEMRTQHINKLKKERILNNILIYKNSSLTLNNWFEQFRYIEY
jgi:hypothetical protein